MEKRKYNFLKENGEVVGFDSYVEAGEYFNLPKYQISWFWEWLNKLKPISRFTKEQAIFLDKYRLSHSTFNVGCLQTLHAVYLFDAKFQELENEN